MSLATLIKFISNLAKILLKEIKDMKIDRKKKKHGNNIDAHVGSRLVPVTQPHYA